MGDIRCDITLTYKLEPDGRLFVKAMSVCPDFPDEAPFCTNLGWITPNKGEGVEDTARRWWGNPSWHGGWGYPVVVAIVEAPAETPEDAPEPAHNEEAVTV